MIVYEAESEGAVNIYTIDPETGDTVQITHEQRFTGNPAWSPDRRRIIFSSNRETAGPSDLYVMDADGSDVRRLTETEVGELSAKYSPDGKSIAYTRHEGEGWSIWVMDADATGARRLTPDYAFAEFPTWSGDGRTLYYSARTKETPADIFRVNVAGGAVETVIATPGLDVCPHVSADGRTLTYGSQGPDGDNVDIYAHDLASDDSSGAGDTRLTDSPERDDYANWGPGDHQIVFTSHRDGNTELYLMARDGSEQQRLTTTPDARENVPDW